MQFKGRWEYDTDTQFLGDYKTANLFVGNTKIGYIYTVKKRIKEPYSCRVSGESGTYTYSTLEQVEEFLTSEASSKVKSLAHPQEVSIVFDRVEKLEGWP